MITTFKSFITLLFAFNIIFTVNCGNKKEPVGFDIHAIEGEKARSRSKSKEDNPIQSYYKLETLKVVGVREGNVIPYITLTIVLGYPFNDLDSEKEIIYNRDLIRGYITEYLSLKTYSQLNSVEKKERLKKHFLYIINRKFLKDHKILSIYFTKYLPLKTTPND